jgi:hypothetical protein
MAQALGIPTFMGLGHVEFGRMEGREIVVDGYIGRVVIDPAQPIRAEYRRLIREEQYRIYRSLLESFAPRADGCIGAPFRASSTILVRNDGSRLLSLSLIEPSGVWPHEVNRQAMLRRGPGRGSRCRLRGRGRDRRGRQLHGADGTDRRCL